MEALSVMDLEEIVEDEEVVSEIDAIPTGPLEGSWETPMGLSLIHISEPTRPY